MWSTVNLNYRLELVIYNHHLVYLAILPSYFVFFEKRYIFCFVESYIMVCSKIFNTDGIYCIEIVRLYSAILKNVMR